MRQDIRHAGLTSELERRLKLAARTLSLHGMEATVQAWEGSGCRLVVIGVDDAYGRHVFDVARRRQVPLIAVGAGADGGAGHAALPPEASVSALAAALQATLQQATPSSGIRGNGSASAHVTAPSHEGWLQSLARDQVLSRHPVRVKHGSRSLYILPERGRVYAHTRSDLIEMRDRCSQPGFELAELAAERELPANAEVSEGMDAYFVSCALRASAHLPPFDDVPCRLDCWPDLASAGDAPQALRIAAPMLRAPRTQRELAAALGVDPGEVSACFWAFCAAGLLQRQATAVAPTPSPARSGVWSRLAQRFGLA